MALLPALGPTSPPKVLRSRGVGVVYEFVKQTTNPGVYIVGTQFTREYFWRQ